MTGTAPAEYAFDRALALTPGAEAGDPLVADLDAGWSIAGKLHGGYLLALAARAALTAVDHPQPLTISAHFLHAPVGGKAEVVTEQLRAGRTVSTSRAILRQGGRAVLDATVTAGHLEPGAAHDWVLDQPPVLPPVEECVESSPVTVDGQPMGLMDHVELRLDPATIGWAAGKPSGHAAARAWLRLRDDRPHDAESLLLACDALPPTVFDLGLLGWSPTVQLTAMLRALPAPGWLRVVARTAAVGHGWFDEQAEVWDSEGQLVLQSHQLAGIRRA